MKKACFVFFFCIFSVLSLFAQTKKTPESILGITEASVLESLDTEDAIQKLQTALKNKKSLSIDEQLDIQIVGWYEATLGNSTGFDSRAEGNHRR